MVKNFKKGGVLDMGTALAVLCVCWIFSMFFGAGPKRFIRVTGTIISAILAIIANILVILAIVVLVAIFLAIRSAFRRNRHHF